MYCVPIFDAHMLHKNFGDQRLLPITSKEPRGAEGMSERYVIQVYGPHNRLLPPGEDRATNPNANRFLLKRYPTKEGKPHYTLHSESQWFPKSISMAKITTFYWSLLIKAPWRNIREKGLFQLIKGLKAIHSAREGHFDVKPENVLVESNGADSTHWLFKFADFGSSNAKGGNLLNATCRIILMITRSSPKITWAADIWSLGCIYSEAAMWIADGKDSRTIASNEWQIRTESCSEVVIVSMMIEDRLRRSDYITQDVLDSMVEEMLWEEDRPNGKALWRKTEAPPRNLPPGLSSIAERQYVDNVEKWRSQVTGSVVSSSQPSRPPSDISSPPLPHAQLSRAATVTTDLDREINGSIASWQMVDNTSQDSAITPFTSPHVSVYYQPSLNDAPPVRHCIRRPHPPIEYRSRISRIYLLGHWRYSIPLCRGNDYVETYGKA
ncbi:hypothetical protein V1525DRAFT_422450 [Lipomyces kononenkoae]|uniref:Uncharacterized protein n=1 Tax=Lipomyces kononenkoae TaxID=34357 RepID=A0ACC3SS81_LIPKO